MEAEPQKLNKRQQKKATTRQKLLDAAKELFTSSSYEDVTIRGIADKMGMSTGSVFSNFESKADIFAEIAIAEMAAQADIARAVVRDARDLRSALDALLVSLYEREIEQLPFLRARFSVMWRWVGQDDPHIAKARKKVSDAEGRLMGVACRVLERGAKAGQLFSDHDYCTLVWDLHCGNLRRLAEGYDLEHIKENLHEQLDIIIMQP